MKLMKKRSDLKLIKNAVKVKIEFKDRLVTPIKE